MPDSTDPAPVFAVGARVRVKSGTPSNDPDIPPGGSSATAPSRIDSSGEFATTPILADALQDAGCDRAEVLNHCRGPTAHRHDCWLVGAILGKP